MIKVVILGSGNVGRHLFKAFKNNSEIEITQWYSRNIKDIHPYSNFVEITDQLDKLVLADIYILAVSDDSIHDLSNQLSFSNRFVCHTSGSKSKNELNQKIELEFFTPFKLLQKKLKLIFQKFLFA
jgi:predicted dinucleotide-utilizing enzyme